MLVNLEILKWKLLVFDMQRFFHFSGGFDCCIILTKLRFLGLFE